MLLRDYQQGGTCVSSHRKTCVQEVYIVKDFRIESKMYIYDGLKVEFIVYIVMDSG
jgi:hypothetical protein